MSGHFRDSPRELLGTDVEVEEFQSTKARDPILIVRFADGGLLSYRRENGDYVHTLNTSEGLGRKLAQLGYSGDG